MKSTSLFAAILALSIVSAFAEPPNYTAVEAGKHVGETATVTDKVDGVYKAKGGNIFLNMGGAHPNEAFTAFIPASVAEKFPDVRKYEGATITVSGKITSHNDKPEIAVQSPDQITVKEAASDKNETNTPSPSPAG
jgi:hypothetical protein